MRAGPSRCSLTPRSRPVPPPRLTRASLSRCCARLPPVHPIDRVNRSARFWRSSRRRATCGAGDAWATSAGSLSAGCGSPVGAAWYRAFTRQEPGYGFVAADVPELALAVTDGARGPGIGSMLMRELIVAARNDDRRALSLSVALDNPVLRLYERLGFVAVETTLTHQTMCLEL